MRPVARSRVLLVALFFALLSTACKQAPPAAESAAAAQLPAATTPAGAPEPSPAKAAAPSAAGTELSAEPARVSAAPTGIFWRVSSQTATVYLLGSIHVGKESFYPLAQVVEGAFEKAEKLVVEIEMTPETEAAAAMKLLRVGRLPAGDTLTKHLDEASHQLYLQRMKEVGLPAAGFESFRPWFAALTLTVMQLQKLGYSPDQGIDRHYMERAQAKGTPIVALETVDEQVGLFTGLSEEVQLLMLKETLAELGKLGEMLGGMLEAWKRGDDAHLEKLLMEEMHKPEYRALFQKLFLDRNVRMAEKIAGFLKDRGTYFVVVGAGHLVGKKGIVDILRERGFQPDRPGQPTTR